MDVQISHHEDITVLALLRPPQDTEQATIVKRLRNFCRAGHTKIVFDLRQLEHITSTAIGILVQASDTVKENGGRLLLTGLHPRVERILEMMDLRSFFEIHDTFAHAVAALGGDVSVAAQHEATGAAERAGELSRRELAEQLIHHVVHSRLHVRLVQLLATKRMNVVSVKSLAKVTGESEPALFRPLHDLAKAGILKSLGQGTAYNYAPSPERAAEINAFLRLWADSRSHGELLALVLERERRGGE